MNAPTMNNNETVVEEDNGLPPVLNGDGVVEDPIRKQLQAAIVQKKKKKTELRRNEINTLLNRHATSIESLVLLSIQEIQQARYEENGRAIPEGNEDEDEVEEEDDDDDDDDNKDESNEKTIILLSLSDDSSTDLTDSDSNFDCDCDCDYNIEIGSQQREQKQKQQRTIFSRIMKWCQYRRRYHHRTSIRSQHYLFTEVSLQLKLHQY